MVTALISVRDFLLAAALAWVGVTFQAQSPTAPHTQQPHAASTAACADPHLCSSSVGASTR